MNQEIETLIIKYSSIIQSIMLPGSMFSRDTVDFSIGVVELGNSPSNAEAKDQGIVLSVLTSGCC